MGKEGTRHAGCGPRRNAAGGKDAGVAIAGFFCHIIVPFDNDYFMSCFGQKIGGTYPNDTCTDNRYLHYFYPSQN
ncbi:hypothetical protein D3C81_1790650 [compost metagenome]